MTSNEIKNLLYRHLTKNVTVPIFKDVHPPITETKNYERIVINVNAIDGGSWGKGFANINWYVPDLKSDYEEPNHIGLNLAERLLKDLFDHGTLLGADDARVFCESHKITQVKDNYSHYINLSILLTITNF